MSSGIFDLIHLKYLVSICTPSTFLELTYKLS